MNQGKSTTLHQRILDDIEGRIVSGDWPPGHRIPFEVDLALHYDCSRMTVNKVLTQLAKAGLIERRKRSGSFVTRPRAQSAILEIHDIREEVLSLNLGYAYRMIRQTKRKTRLDDTRRLELSVPSSVVEIIGVHYAGEQPFCLEERIINLAAVPEADGVDFNATSPGPWLLKQVPWSAAEHLIRATSATAEVAKTLDLGSDISCLVIERRTWNAAGPITHVRLTYPGEKHALVARFAPSS